MIVFLLISLALFHDGEMLCCCMGLMEVLQVDLRCIHDMYLPLKVKQERGEVSHFSFFESIQKL